ncbi:MAG: hypothetical protein ACYDAZ_00645 [Thermoplasmataceae archaeon]
MKLSDLGSVPSLFANSHRKSPQDFFEFEPGRGVFRCLICNVRIGTRSSTRWSHIHLKHREVLP